MAAQFVDALKGYDYYIENRGKVSLENINDYLESKGRNPVRERTYGHYQKLLKRGFISYIPINQFDVYQTLDKLQMATDRRRYPRDIIDIDTKFSLERRTWIPAKIIDRSLVGFGMAIYDKFPIKPGTLIWVHMINYLDIPTMIVWKRRYENHFRFGLRALDFIANYLISKEDIIPRPTSLLIVQRNVGDNIDWEELYRMMTKINQLIEASSDLLDTVARISNRKLKLEKPFISSIKFGSPGDIQVKVDLGAAEVMKIALDKAQLWKLEKERFKLENRGKDIKNSLLEIELIRNAVKLRKEVIESGISSDVANLLFGCVIKKALDIEELPDSLFESGSLETGILLDRLLPAALELVAGDAPNINVEIQENMT
jgi:hypothetical protein